jgi:hypothetical protein
MKSFLYAMLAASLFSLGLAWAGASSTRTLVARKTDSGYALALSSAQMSGYFQRQCTGGQSCRFGSFEIMETGGIYYLYAQGVVEGQEGLHRLLLEAGRRGKLYLPARLEGEACLGSQPGFRAEGGCACAEGDCNHKIWRKN